MSCELEFMSISKISFTSVKCEVVVRSSKFAAVGCVFLRADASADVRNTHTRNS